MSVPKLKSLQKTQATSGTAEPLSAVPFQRSVIAISTPSTNTATVFISNESTGVQAAGFALPPGTMMPVQDAHFGVGRAAQLNLADIYMDSPTSGQKVTVAYLQDE